MVNAIRIPRFATLTSDLRSDQRGAVMVVGVFMAAFLVGSLWYIIGIGDAILYRERMQDGADAVAFAAAVYHARGMNIIAMINIIMAAILAILVAFKLLQLINNIALAVSTVVCGTGYGSAIACPVEAFTTELVDPIDNAVTAAEELVNTTLPVLSKTQVGIAYAMPWIAQAKAVSIASSDYSEPVESGGFLSTSLIPNVPQERLGLPVQEDEYQFLCKKAGEYVGEIVFSPFPPAIGNFIAGVIGGIVQTFPGYFCNESGGWGNNEISQDISQDTIDNMAKEACEKKKEDEGGPFFDTEACEDEITDDIEKRLEKQEGSSGVDGNDKTPKKVFWGAKNGNSYFQIWSVLVGNEEWPKGAEKGVKIAAWDKSVSMPEMPWGKVAFSQAEYYYDDAGEWDDMKKDAMWNMFWRARLRRVRTPSPTVGGLIMNEKLSILTGKISPKVIAALGGSEIAGWLFGEAAGGTFENIVGAVHNGGGPWQDQFISNPNLANGAKVEIIH